MDTSKYVEQGKNITEHLGPVNAVMFVSTGVLVPVMDVVRPHFPYINYVAGLVVLVFLGILAMRFFKVPSNRFIPNSLVLTAGICAGAFSVGAVASSKHAEGFLAAHSADARALQSSLLSLNKQTSEISSKLDKQGQTLTQIRDGKSTDPRIELRNLGFNWDSNTFWTASKAGDLRVVELFLQSGMSLTGDDGYTLPFSMIKRNNPKLKEQFLLFQKYGYDLNDKKLVSGNPDKFTPPNLYAAAKEEGNESAAELLKSLGVDSKGYDQWVKTKPPKPAPSFYSIGV